MSLAIRRTGPSFRSGTKLGSRKGWRSRAEENEGRIDEGTLDRLKRAEEEAAELRREVASLKAYQVAHLSFSASMIRWMAGETRCAGQGGQDVLGRVQTGFRGP